MDKKRLILLIILLLAIVLIVLGVKGNVFKENRQNMELRSSGDDNSHWFHLSGCPTLNIIKHGLSEHFKVLI